jgi:hypothetical protein
MRKYSAALNKAKLALAARKLRKASWTPGASGGAIAGHLADALSDHADDALGGLLPWIGRSKDDVLLDLLLATFEAASLDGANVEAIIRLAASVVEEHGYEWVACEACFNFAGPMHLY